jgi:hypothetical protein
MVLRLNPDHASFDDVCPDCGYLILGGHPSSCAFYDLLDAMVLDLEVDELRKWGWLNPTDKELLEGFIELLTNPEWATPDEESDSDDAISDDPLDLDDW